MRYSHIVEAPDYGQERETVISDFAGHLAPVYGANPPQMGKAGFRKPLQPGHPQLGAIDFTEIFQSGAEALLVEATGQLVEQPGVQEQLQQQAEEKAAFKGWTWIKANVGTVALVTGGVLGAIFISGYVLKRK